MGRGGFLGWSRGYFHKMFHLNRYEYWYRYRSNSNETFMAKSTGHVCHQTDLITQSVGIWAAIRGTRTSFTVFKTSPHSSQLYLKFGLDLGDQIDLSYTTWVHCNTILIYQATNKTSPGKSNRLLYIFFFHMPQTDILSFNPLGFKSNTTCPYSVP